MTKKAKWQMFNVIRYSGTSFLLILAIACGGANVQEKSSGSKEENSQFITKWQTSSANESIALPLPSGYKYDFTIDWGDGSPIAKVTSHSDPDAMHVYADGGEYEVKMDGLMEAWSFGAVPSSSKKLIEVISFGDMGWKNLHKAFYGSAIKKFVGGITRDVTDMSFMFSGTTSLEAVDLSSFDTSKVTTMEEMFSFTYELTTLDLHSFDTSKVTTMRSMFLDSHVLNIDLSSFDTSNVTDMAGMFQDVKLQTLNLSSFDTSNVTDMLAMFFDAKHLEVLNANGWVITQVSNSADIFYNAGVSSAAGFTVLCNQGGSSGTGTLFGEPCN
ncbi:MAG: BspA family leucine-rich repeat surface protein [Bdellovibrionota bacterium]